MLAGHLQVKNLRLIIDNNGLQSLTTTAETLNMEPLKSKFENFGWSVINVNGHDHTEMQSAFVMSSEKPLCIIADTTKGKGVSFMENQVSWHYKAPDKSELNLALNEVQDKHA